jgi:hypothetical protein
MTSGQVSVGHVGGDVYEIHVRGHHLTVDQPVETGGTDKAPTPTELFAASLAACVAFLRRPPFVFVDVNAFMTARHVFRTYGRTVLQNYFRSSCHPVLPGESSC